MTSGRSIGTDRQPRRIIGERTSPGAKVTGAPGQIRTADTRFRRAVLYPLSYGGQVVIVNHDHPV